jgi:iron complex transport system ATP-binding protein
MTAGAAPLLEFERVGYGYGSGQTEALREFSAEVRSAAVTAVLGPNGAGKTTLLHLALGWLSPREGRVLFGGRPLSSYSRRELGRSIAFVPQSERIPFQYSVLEYVVLGRASYLPTLALPGAKDIGIGKEAIDRVGIAALAHRDVTTLSGGERQLASIARAIAQGPKLLLLDEPTSHLDLANKARLLELVLELKAAGTTVLFTTHEPDAAAAVATRIVLMRSGRALKSGDLDEVFSSESLSETYGFPVGVSKVDGRRIVGWTPVSRRPDATDD